MGRGMKNKGKKLYLTIMTLCLAITVMITSSITLAFFGSSAGGSTVIKLSNSLIVNNATTIITPARFVSPSEMVTFDATAIVKSPGDSENTDGLLRAKVETLTNGVPDAKVNAAVVGSTVVNGDTVYWKSTDDGYFYLVKTENGEELYTIDTTNDTSVLMKLSIFISEKLGNTDGGGTYQISVTFCTIQAVIYGENGTSPIVNTITATEDIFNQVENY